MKLKLALATASITLIVVISLTAFAGDDSISAPSDAQAIQIKSIEMGQKLIRVDVVDDPSCVADETLCSGTRNVPVYSDAVAVTVSYTSESEGVTNGKIENCSGDLAHSDLPCMQTNEIEKTVYLDPNSLSASQLDRVTSGDSSAVGISQSHVSPQEIQIGISFN